MKAIPIIILFTFISQIASKAIVVTKASDKNDVSTTQQGKSVQQVQQVKSVQVQQGKPIVKQVRKELDVIASCFKNCLFYATSSTITDFGCGQCAASLELQESASGNSGICKTSSSAVANCSWKILTDAGVHTCNQCKSTAFILSLDKTKCTSRSPSTVVANCVSYQELATGTPADTKCIVCKKGYTVNSAGTACVKENCNSNVKNCLNCADSGATHFCFNCKPGFVGVHDAATDLYSECIDVNTWRCRTLTEDAQDCCLKKLK
jgi:hypothetical protein